MDRFTKKAAAALGEAMECAGRLGHTYIGSEHLLLGILRQGDSIGARLLLSRGITFEKAEKKVAALVGSGSATVLSGRDMTPRARRIIEQSFAAARRYGQTQVGTEHLLSALLRERQSTAAAVIGKMGTDAASLNEMVTERLSMSELSGERGGKAPKMLQKYGTNLTARAALGQLDPLVGRTEEIQRLMVILCRRRKNNPCLIGQPGVGKTVLVEGLAQAIVEGRVPSALQGKQIWQLELTGMVAGSKYRGEFEERIRGVVDECEKNPDILLFIDEVHTIMGAGAAEGAVDAANILKPALSRGKLRLIGATTLAEYRKHIEKDSALERRFAPLTVEEPSPEQSKEILRGLRERLEEHHRLSITEQALTAAVDLSVRYLHDRFLPDKAIDLLDEACSEVAMSRKEQGELALEHAIAAGEMRSYLQQQAQQVCLQVDEKAVASVVARATGIPAGSIGQSEKNRLSSLADILGRRVLGQQRAVEAVAGAVRCARLGLGQPNRPVGCFLFAGPTGVGKTELCRALGQALFDSEKAVIKLDMSEYMEKHSVARLIGAPPGYVGYENGGTLIDAVRTRPYSVVVFDEVEKAHPDVCSLLLQIMEDGKLTESSGKCADFRHCIVILTTNLGAGAVRNIGFGASHQQREETLKKALQGHFPPELINRLDEVISFSPLEQESLCAIAHNMLQQLSEQLAAEGTHVTFDDSVAQWMAAAPDTALYGARPLRRFLHRYVEIPLCEALLSESICSGDCITREMLQRQPAACKS